MTKFIVDANVAIKWVLSEIHSNRCQLVTADERFYNALLSNVLSAHLMWIEEIP